MAWVSTARRNVRSPTSSDDSHTVLFHSIVVAPQMSLTRMSRRPCAASSRSTRPDTCSGTRWSTGTAMPRPPACSTSAAVSSMVSGRFISERCSAVVRPVAYTVAPAAPNCTAMPRPAARVAPVTSATLPASGWAMPASRAVVDALQERMDVSLLPDAVDEERIIVMERLHCLTVVGLEHEQAADHRLPVVGEQRTGDDDRHRGRRRQVLLVL